MEIAIDGTGRGNYSEILNRAMDVQTEEEAAVHFNELLEYKVLMGVRSLIARTLIKVDLGYWAAYGSEERRERIERLYNCAHPIFGSIKENGQPTTAEAFELGTNRAKGSGPQTLSDLRKMRQ